MKIFNCNKKSGDFCRGVVLVITMIFMAVFSSLALAICTMSSTNVQVANNHSQSNRALLSAESGADVVRYWLDRAYIDGTTSESERFDAMAGFVQNDLATNAGVTSEHTAYSSLAVDSVTLDASAQQFFTALLQPAGTDAVQMDITGQAGGITRTIRANYTYGVREDSVFDYGVATRGSLELSGNVELGGTNVSVEASVYIESDSDNNALSIIGNSQIAGNVTITNPTAQVTLQGAQAGIGGDTGQDAIDNHVTTGAPHTDFPVPNPDHFAGYLDGSVIDSDTDTSADATFENVRILAGTNPSFSGNVTLSGIVFIETPNVVTFSGNANVTGIIVGDGDINDNSGTNQIIFLGNVSSSPVTELPFTSQFDGVRDETGTFLIAPGFSAAFGGSFDTLNGAIAANGINFFGNAGGTIAGSVVNLSDTPMTVSGNADLFFNRSGITEVPAGFEPEIILHYDSSSYCEIANQ